MCQEMEVAERVEAETLHRERFYQVLKGLTLLLLTNTHEHDRKIILKRHYKNSYTDKMNVDAMKRRKITTLNLSHTTTRIAANANATISGITRQTDNIGGKSKVARTKREQLASEKHNNVK